LSQHNPLAQETLISDYCNAKKPVNPSVHIYGHYEDNRLVSVMTATFMLVMPHEDSPNGRVVQISGAYTHIDYRHRNIASSLLQEIQEDA
jgi:ribosomal protein S18 acetylase RimI-like enzyme